VTGGRVARSIGEENYAGSEVSLGGSTGPPDPYGCTLPDSGDDLDAAAHDVRSLLHAHEAEPTTVLPRGLEIESPAVVGDRHLDMLAKSCQRNVESCRFAVHDPVSERLLSDSEETDGNIRIQVPKVPGLEPDLDVVPLPDLGAVPLQCWRKAEYSE
jgi:hypothetical protein